MFASLREFAVRVVGVGLLLGLCILTTVLVGWTTSSSFGTAEAAGVHEVGVTFAGEGLRLTAYFKDDSVQIVFSDGRDVVLDRAISASGARYTDGDTVFWNKGAEATVEWDGITHTVRVVDAATDVWERAVRAGVDFRAVGQEPGWLLEIRDEESIQLALDYGTTQITTPISGLHTDYATGTRTFEATPPLSPLLLTIYVSQQVCYDVMSGEGFMSTVVVQMGETGATYFGCGRDL